MRKCSSTVFHDNLSRILVETSSPNGTNIVNEDELIKDENLRLLKMILLMLLFLISLLVNLTILLAFYKKQSLRTISNSFIMNLLVVNLVSTLILLPLVSMDLLVSPVSVPGRCLLSEAVSHMLASLSLFSTLLIAVDQYLAIIHALRYHHHMTRFRCSISLFTIWILSTLLTVISVSFEHNNPHIWNSCSSQIYIYEFKLPDALLSCGIASIRFLAPVILIIIIYAKIYLEAHSNSERRRKCSMNQSEYVSTCLNPSESISTCLNPSESISTCLDPSESISTNLNAFESDSSNINQWELDKIKANILKNSIVQAKSSPMLQPPDLIKARTRRLSASACCQKNNMQNQRKNSLPANFGHRISYAGLLIKREEDKTAKIYIISLITVLGSWSPFFLSNFGSQFLHFPFFSWSSFPILYLALLFAATSPFIFGLRNRRIRREVLHILRIRTGLDHLSPVVPRMIRNFYTNRKIRKKISKKENSENYISP